MNQLSAVRPNFYAFFKKGSRSFLDPFQKDILFLLKWKQQQKKKYTEVCFFLEYLIRSRRCCQKTVKKEK